MSAPAQSGPQPAPTAPTTLSPPLQTALDNSIWYLLNLWPPLHVALTNAWGGPASDDKRDWFAGAVSDLLTTRPATDAEDLECVLLQIMQDEFECNVEDESEVPLARDILRVRTRLLEEGGSVEAAEEVRRRWEGRGRMKGDVVVREVEEEAEWHEVVDDEDEEMEDAPPLVSVPATVREKVEPEIDEDGFQKVVSRKKR